MTAAQAAARLGVKRQTLYAYVSRGLLHRTVALDGRSSMFDPHEVEQFRMRGADREDGELRTLIATSITRVDDDQLLVRGQDLVELVRKGTSFVEVADLIWQGGDGETWPAVEPELTTTMSGLDGLRSLVAQASHTDPLRHDLSERTVRACGRRMITTMASGLPPKQKGRSTDLVEMLWRRLTPRRGSIEERATLDLALALLADHGLASSTFAARVAASVRADPYSVVSTGMGAVGGLLHGAASAAVHELIADAKSRGDIAAAVGDVVRRIGRVPGFGHTVYSRQDPRYGALMAQVMHAWADDPRLAHIHRLRDVAGDRHGMLPNVDLALGAMTWLSGMDADAGESIFAVARTVGWIAHALEEYGETALRFRTIARYLGPR